MPENKKVEPLPRCERCRKRVTKRNYIKIQTTTGWERTVWICSTCFERWDETLPLILIEFMRGALYPKNGKLFLASHGTYGGILRGAEETLERCKR